MRQIKIIKPSNQAKKINDFDVTEATNTGVTDTNGNPIYLGDIVKTMPQEATVRVLVYYPNDGTKPILYSYVRDLIPNRYIVQNIITAALKAANSRKIFSDILTDLDIEIMFDAKQFTKTVKISDEISLQITIKTLPEP